MRKLLCLMADLFLKKRIDTLARETVRQKMPSSVAMYVNAVRVMEREYGKEAIEKIHSAFMERVIRLGESASASMPDNSLNSFCHRLEEGISLTHEWKKVIDEDDRQGYVFTYCMWAEVFRELGAEDIGYWICEGDGPAAEAFNPIIEFKRTKTLMMGDDCCDHVFFVGSKNRN